MLEPGLGPGATVLPAAAAAFAAFGGAGGFLVVDQQLIDWIDGRTGQPVQPTLLDSMRRLVWDFAALLFIAFGAYLAHFLVRRGT